MRPSTHPVYIQACSLHSALGCPSSDIHSALQAGENSNMRVDRNLLNDGSETIVGAVTDKLPLIPTHLSHYDTRNNQLALSALMHIEEQVKHAIEHYGNERVAVVIGTSTSGISDGELAFKALQEQGQFPDSFHYSQQELSNVSEFVSDYLGTSGPNYVISTACSSSGRVFLTAKRLLKSGLVDAVIVGGVDTLCKLTLNGFHSLEALSSTLCQPFGAHRNGINIGEAAAFMLLTLDKPPASTSPTVALLGAGDSSDAHHISAPHPEGNGAEQAMRKALQDANLTPESIGYINAHGTATPLNDSMESKAIYRLFGECVPVSSTKPLTGHTLGAASAVEAALAWHILKFDLSLPLQKTQDKAEDIQIDLVNCQKKSQSKAVLSNSFAFGGNNISLIFGIVDD
ncbi:beta-ketoacyl-[acyl-carrier-protein] synthase family protein [Vibrio makurazakiensis]|uniref:beta-ketoacyl-[acyl-carrier-protein] synthase family protein n=1 Tax=Vibrio makurazakiensis TaxID=2910250 RepID=UPI003D0D2253